MEDVSVFFTKPHIDKPTALEVILMAEDYLEDSGGFKKLFQTFVDSPTYAFWDDFYVDLKGKWDMREDMIEDFMRCSTLRGHGLHLRIYNGENVASRLKDALGPTKYRDNLGQGTVRESFMNPNVPSWHTVAHAPKPEEVRDNLDVLVKHRYIPNSLYKLL